MVFGRLCWILVIFMLLVIFLVWLRFKCWVMKLGVCMVLLVSRWLRLMWDVNGCFLVVGGGGFINLMNIWFGFCG